MDFVKEGSEDFNIHVRDRSLSTADLDAVVSSAVGNIYLKIRTDGEDLAAHRYIKSFRRLIIQTRFYL